MPGKCVWHDVSFGNCVHDKLFELLQLFVHTEGMQDFKQLAGGPNLRSVPASCCTQADTRDWGLSRSTRTSQRCTDLRVSGLHCMPGAIAAARNTSKPLADSTWLRRRAISRSPFEWLMKMSIS